MKHLLTHPLTPSGMAVGLLAVVLGTGLCSAADDPDATPSLTIDQTRDQLEQWVETRRLISKEKRDLEIARELLLERIAVIEAEIEAIRGKIVETEESLAKTDEQYNELTSENEMLKGASETLLATLGAMEEQVRRLLISSPTPVVNQVKILSQQIPGDPESTDLPMSNRYQNVIGILNEINKFNSVVTVANETREVGDGQSAEVTVMYLGVSKAYYTGRSGAIGGVGTPAADGWDWEPVNSAGPAIKLAIDIYKNEEVAAFVDLPLEVQ
ncbi:DUF3450 family protein [Mucisphaera calidilacus]|uniref:DUF3450 family protein n=1 Tax=Mucisphaera calidilacus TaxID=2527982 RepID=A0A518BUD9_9BACT|nr:DUF3450 family protein [Mucisphaera calidilacus]QDU70598.1 hypothetical protein Pan265_04260 [Mucisphaera calidilacus]